MQAGAPHVSQWSCVILDPLGTYSEPQIDCLILTSQTEQYSSHLHPELPNGDIQGFSINPRAPSARQTSCTAHPPKSQVIIPITQRTNAPCAFYCSPSGLSELLPARRISSVDNKLMAITELRNPDKVGVKGSRFVLSCQLSWSEREMHTHLECSICRLTR
jgi:hypothetical protein